MRDRPQTAASRAYEHIKLRLLNGTYGEGELLSEGAIATELGISRTPVREACLQLESEGLLRLYPKRGALVVPIGSREIAELFEARELVERHALAHVSADAGLIAQLDTLVERQRAIVAGDGTRYDFNVSDREFHRTWVETAGNGVLLDLYDHLRDRQQRVTSVMLANRPQIMSSLVEEHAAIAAALRDGDRETADARLVEHLRVARERSGGTAAQRP
jgi:DNA-binding GntR family transcriptional regulator